MRRGFTLVEMLVATALVMLMMLLFAEVFGAAVSVITAQKGLGNNDQKARAVTAILKHDFEGRTYRASKFRGATKELVPALPESPRGVVPLGPGDSVDELQRGFLCISENDVDDDTDDVLHLTVSVPAATGEDMLAPFYGRADSTLGGINDLNVPDCDDGVVGDNASTSRAAEIVYFLRGRNLYRRVMLIRQPAAGATEFGTQPSQGERGTGGAFNRFEQQYPAGTSLYHDWDFSGTRAFVADTNTNGTVDDETADDYRFHFHGIESLDNGRGSNSLPLGIPWNRFGFYSRFGVNRPVEYVADSGGNLRYIGRFTHEETSHPLFDWPGNEGGATANIMARTDLILSPEGVVTIDNNTNGSFDPGVDQPLQGNRTGEDILLTNVEAFDIEVWDPGFAEADFNGSGAWDPFVPADDRNMNGVQDQGAWVDLGNNTGVGIFTETWNSALPGITGNATWGRQNAAYGPGGPAGNHVFDTWHPEAGIDVNGDGVVAANERALPPYRPLQLVLPSDFVWTPNSTGFVRGDTFMPDILGRDGQPGEAGVDDDGDGTIDNITEIGFPGTDDNRSIGYVVVSPPAVGGVQGVTGSRQPEWPRIPGVMVVDGNNEDLNNNLVLDANEDDGPGGLLPDDNGDGILQVPVIWQCFDNRIGLEQIRITIRYRDVSTQQARQVTFVHSLVD